jgi:hypothetical protein
MRAYLQSSTRWIPRRLISARLAKSEKEKKPSNQELSTILKYGAQNMFKTDDKELNKKLDEMDLDDILSRAEQHDTVVTDAAGSSLGGEGFLASLAEVTDVKTDINWDEIIPLDERQRVEREDAEKQAERLAAEATQGRKRQAANVTYEGMDMMDPSVATAGDKKKKETKAPAPARKTAAAKSMELKDRDIRVLVRSLQRWGDVRTRYDEIVSCILALMWVAANRNNRSVMPAWKARTKASSMKLPMVSLSSARRLFQPTRPKSGNASNPASNSPLHRRARLSSSHSAVYRISTLRQLSLAITS